MRTLFIKLLGLAAATLIAFTNCSTKESNNRRQETSSEENIYGVDVSHHNGVIDWKRLAEKEKMAFAFMKATEGSTMVDSRYDTNVSSARKAGLKVGAYHFLTTSSSAEEQFRNFKRVVKADDIDLLPVLDAERITNGYPMTEKEYVKHVRTWVDLCKEHYGKTPIIYSSIGFYRKYFKGKFDDCLFWTGDVNAKRSYVNSENWVIWQKSIRKFHGCSSQLDFNVLAPGKALADLALHPVDAEAFDGIDVSHHNGHIDWKKVKSECPDLKFVYIKCTEGATYVDPEFKANAKGAGDQGYNVGAYHYFRMTSSAHDQFNNFKNQLDDIEFNLIPMVDVERDDDKPRKELQDSLRVLLDLLEEEYGVRPMLYGTNASYNKFCAPEFNQYLMYIGRYGTDEPIVKGSGHYTIWQYSESGMIIGIPRPVDLCRFHLNRGIDDVMMRISP